jgi:hypothetical protein
MRAYLSSLSSPLFSNSFLDKEGWCPGFIETTPRVLQRLQEITGSAGYPAQTPSHRQVPNLLQQGGQNETTD